MALITCSKCGKQISSTEKKCPACGETVKQKKTLLLGFILFFVVGVGFTIFFSEESTDHGVTITGKPGISSRTGFPFAVEEYFNKNLSYPQTLQKVSDSFENPEDNTWVYKCVIQSKNSFGVRVEEEYRFTIINHKLYRAQKQD
ncbi:zinc-ribbon domain-containing protein [Candidatus Riflebacteria bacterium]